MDPIEKKLRLALAALLSQTKVDDRAYNVAALRLAMGLLVPHKQWTEVTKEDLPKPSIDELFAAIRTLP
jgi:hypothetical protein